MLEVVISIGAIKVQLDLGNRCLKYVFLNQQ